MQGRRGSCWQVQLVIGVLAAATQSSTAVTNQALVSASPPNRTQLFQQSAAIDVRGQAAAYQRAASPNENVAINCSLAVQGFGNSSSTIQAPPQLGVRSASLNCTASPAAAATAAVGYQTSILGRFVAGFQGVHPVNNTSCQERSFRNETALLYFCAEPGTVVQLWRPEISGVWLETPPEGKDSGLLAVGHNGTVIVEGGTFLDNHAGSVLAVADTAVLYVRGSYAAGNSAKGGGVLRIGDQASAVVGGGAVFYNNTAHYGGALYMYGGADVVLTGSVVVSDNNATKDSQNGAGGGAYAKDTVRLQVTNSSRITGNTSPNGGGVALEGQAVCTIANAVIAENVVTYKTGGGVYLKGDAHCSLVNASVVNNYAKKQGGGIGLEDSSRTICVVSRGTAVSGNRAAEQGGGLYLGPGSTATLEAGCLVANNWAKSGGGAFLWGEDAKGSTSLTVSGPGTAFTGNTASAGAAINVYAAEEDDRLCYVTVKDRVEFKGNAAEQGGGAYVANGMCTATFMGVTFERNVDLKFAGVLSLYQSAVATFVGCTLRHSSAKDAAAANIGQNASATFINSILAGHTAVHTGGAMKVVENATVTFINSVVHDCFALLGGAIAIEDNGTVYLNHSTLMRNRARTSGGAVSMLGPGTPQLVLKNGSSCTSNTASVSGGCVYLVTAGMVVPDSSSSITNNTARLGGGIALAALDRAPDLSSLRGSVCQNAATMFGSELYVDYTEITLCTQRVAVDATALSLKQLVSSGGRIPYVSRTTGPGLNISVTAHGSNSTQAAAAVKVDALLLLDGGAAARAAAAAIDGSSTCSSHTTSSMPGTLTQTVSLDSAITDDGGVAAFPDLRPQLPPGTYSLVFQYTTLQGIPFTLAHTLQVRPCVLGEVTGDLAAGEVARTCDVCPAGRFCLSPEPWNRECQQCNSEMADCGAGGAVVVPLPGFWQRSPDSALMHRCLNPAACHNDYTHLLEMHPYRNATPSTVLHSSPALLLISNTAGESAINSSAGSSVNPLNFSTAVVQYLQAQCAVGYTGTLCASCQLGYGMTRQFSCSRCLPAPAVASMYTIGALVLMAVMHAMMHLNTTSDSAAMKSWTAAAQVNSQLLPMATAAGPSAGAQLWQHGAARQGSSATSNASTPRASLATDPLSPRAETASATTATAQQMFVPALPSSVLKVLVLYMQYTLIIAGMAVDWPASLSAPFTVLAGMWSGATSEALAVECLMPSRQQIAANPSVVTSAVPVSVLRMLLYVIVPIIMFCILVLVECLWRASQPWVQAAHGHCIAQHQAQVEGFAPGLTGWRQARVQQRRQVRVAAAAEPAGCAGADGEEPVSRLQDVLVADAPPGPVMSGSNEAFRAQSAVPGWLAGSKGYLPSAAWCGVLAMVIVFFFLTSLARATLGLFICYTLQADPRGAAEHRQDLGQVSLWMYDMSQQCFGPEHKKWALGLGIPLVTLIFGCLPVAVGVLLCRFKHQLTDPWVQKHFGFLYVHYKPTHYLWEVVTILQTFVVVLVSVTRNYLGVYNQALLLNVVLAIIFIMLLLFKPMASREVQLLNYASIGVQLSTTYAALSFIAVSERVFAVAAAIQDEQSSWGFQTYKSVMGVLVLVANLTFIIGLVVVLLMTLPSVFWQSCRVVVLRRWRAFRVTCSGGCRHPLPPPLIGAAPVADPLLSARTPSGHPVLVRLDAHKQLQLTNAVSE